MNRRAVALFGIIFVLIPSFVPIQSPAWGQVKPLTPDELALRADIVVLGKVAAMKSEWNGDRSRIFTRVTVAVDQYIKGEGGDRYLTFVTPGGEVGGVGELYSHAVRFVDDEMVVLFAQKDAQGEFHVAGGEQGKYSVRKDDVTGKPMVSEDISLEEFVARVRSATKTQGGR